MLIAAVGFDQDELEAVFGAVFGVVYQVLEELVHVGLEDVSEVDGVVNLGKNQHKILQMAFFIGLIIRVQVVVMQDLKDLESVSQNGR